MASVSDEELNDPNFDEQRKVLTKDIETVIESDTQCTKLKNKKTTLLNKLFSFKEIDSGNKSTIASSQSENFIKDKISKFERISIDENPLTW